MAKAGVPITLLHEGEGHVCTVEMKSGEYYRGKLDSAEDNMNCTMTDVTHTARNGQVSKLQHVYLRGSHIRFFVLPDILTNAPVFKQVEKMIAREEKKVRERARGGGRGRGRR